MDDEEDSSRDQLKEIEEDVEVAQLLASEESSDALPLDVGNLHIRDDYTEEKFNEKMKKWKDNKQLNRQFTLPPGSTMRMNKQDEL